MRREKFDPKKVYRYASETGTFFIDIDLDFYRELYSEWDFSPQYNRDLDEDLLEYLSACCEEIPRRYRLAISMCLPESVRNPLKEERATRGIHNFFTYLIRRETNRSKSYYIKVLKFLLVGVILLIFAGLLENFLAEIPHTDLLVEGLIIGAWVSIWEVFSILFFKLSDHRKAIANYRRLLGAGIEYRYRPIPAEENPTPDQADLLT